MSSESALLNDIIQTSASAPDFLPSISKYATSPSELACAILNPLSTPLTADNLGNVLSPIDTSPKATNASAVESCLIFKAVAPVAEACSFTISTKFLVDVSALLEPKNANLPVVKLFALSSIITFPVV